HALAFTTTLKVPGSRGERSRSFTFWMPVVCDGALYCQTLPERPTATSASTCSAIGALSPSSSRTVTACAGAKLDSGMSKVALSSPASFFATTLIFARGSEMAPQLHTQVGRQGPPQADADAPSQVSGASTTPFPHVCGSQASPMPSPSRSAW